jgi:hypothetical protein
LGFGPWILGKGILGFWDFGIWDFGIWDFGIWDFGTLEELWILDPAQRGIFLISTTD